MAGSIIHGSGFVAFIDKWDGDPMMEYADFMYLDEYQQFLEEKREQEISDWYEAQETDIDSDLVEIEGLDRVEFEEDIHGIHH